MRSNWQGNTELQRRVQRDDPDARVIVEAILPEAEDIIELPSEWQDADSLSGVTTLDDGGVTISGSVTDHVAIAQSSTAEVISNLPPPTDGYHAVKLQWKANSLNEAAEIHTIVARLDPDTAGTGTEVDRFVCRISRVVDHAFALGEGEGGATFGGGELKEFLPIATAEASVSGDAAGDFTFDFRADKGFAPTIGPAPDSDLPATMVEIWALKSDGTPAGNAAWLGDDTSDGTEDTANASLTHQILQESAFVDADSGSVWDPQGASGMPRFQLQGRTFSSQTVTFTTNIIDLGQSPGSDTVLEVTAQGEAPADTVLTFEISDDGGSTWTETFDGDEIGADNTTSGGADLSSLSRQQTYAMRVTLAPSSDGASTPTARRMGVQELTTTDLSPVLVSTKVGWSFDPVELRGSIPEATFRIFRDGVVDYRDALSDILAQNHIGSVEFRVWIGADDLDRQNWLHVDTYLLEDYDVGGDEITVYGASPSERLKTTVPPYDSGTNTRQPVEYSAQTLKAVYDDLLDAQIALAGRYRGPGVENTSNTVTKRIEDAEGKRELDGIAYLAGGAVISSQGTVKFRQVMEDLPTVEIVPMVDQDLQMATPGYRARIDEYFVPYDWKDSEDRFDGERRGFAGDVITKVGRIHIDPPERLDSDIARWIPSSTLASEVGTRTVDAFGSGLKTLRFQSPTPRPHIEPGDPIVVQTDRMVLRRPSDDAELRGVLWAYGVVQEVMDVWGRDVKVWVKRFDTTLAADEDVGRSNFAAPEVLSVTLNVDTDDGTVDLVSKTEDAGAIRYATSTSAFPNKSTTQSGTLVATSGDRAEVSDLATLAEGETLYVSVLAYENADGSGSESDELLTARGHRTGERSSVNLLGADAGPEQSSDTSGPIGVWEGFEPFSGNGKPIADLGLEADDRLSGLAEVKSDTGADEVGITMAFRDSGGTLLDFTTVTTTTSTHEILKIEDEVIPANTEKVQFYGRNDDGTETAFFRRAMLNRGPIAAPYSQPPAGSVPRAPGGVSVEDVIKHILDSGFAATSMLHAGFPFDRHTEIGTAQDADAVSFSENYGGAPNVTFVPQVGLSYVSGSSGTDQKMDMRPENLGVSGFDLRARLVTSASTTAITDGYSGSQNAAAPENSDVTLSATSDEAFSNLEDANANPVEYRSFYDADTTGLASGSSITLHFWHNDGASSTNWTEYATVTIGDGKSLSDQKVAKTLTLGADYDLRVTVTENIDDITESWSVTMHGEDNTQPGVEYDRDDGTSSLDMTPAAGDAVAYFAKDSS